MTPLLRAAEGYVKGESRTASPHHHHAPACLPAAAPRLRVCHQAVTGGAHRHARSAAPPSRGCEEVSWGGVKTATTVLVLDRRVPDHREAFILRNNTLSITSKMAITLEDVKRAVRRWPTFVLQNCKVRQIIEPHAAIGDVPCSLPPLPLPFPSPIPLACFSYLRFSRATGAAP